MALRRAIAAVSVVGIGLAGYLTYVHYAGIAPVCTSNGCEKVQSSSYASLAGVPVAVIGVAGYALLLALALVPGVAAALAGAIAAVAGAAFGGYLLWAQLARIHAVCAWCVGNDGVIAVAAVLCLARALLEPAEPPPPGPERRLPRGAGGA